MSTLTQQLMTLIGLGGYIRGVPHRGPRGSLPPGQHEVEHLPVVDLGRRPPRITRPEWQLELTGAVSRSLQLNWTLLMAMPFAVRRCDVHCVSRWSRLGMVWAGVPTRALVGTPGLSSVVDHVTVEGYDGYTTNLPLAALTHTDTLLAWRVDDHELCHRHGGPVRLVVPHVYFLKSAKWVKRIEFHSGDRPGFWESRGYHHLADPWREQRYAGQD